MTVEPGWLKELEKDDGKRAHRATGGALEKARLKGRFNLQGDLMRLGMSISRIPAIPRFLQER
jgi:hypothetical protein